MKPAPIEPGAAQERSFTRWVVIALFGQAVVCFLRLWFLWDIWGGFLMALTIMLGYCALRESLPVKLVCLWGVVNAILGAWDALTGLVSLVLFLVSLRWVQCLIIVLVPLAEVLAALVAWQIFKEHELKNGLLAPILKKRYAASSPEDTYATQDTYSGP
uniref:Uncharacterized protein n=1 Tax=Alexandrium andersonii TaxID=327968 RepID=A0A7S2MBT8_9DINO|mmetsp:Transcript_65108/g.146328  ORF Transcript_65108/g.146328 Transcript_65108/m.146328 type:complete len:159 (+) Transcript_65108:144-620(+)